MEDNYKPIVEHQRRLNPNMKEVVRVEVLKWLDAGIIYHISDSSWTSPVHVVLKKGGMTIMYNKNNKIIPTRTVTGWRVCIDYRKLNNATCKDHFPLPFLDLRGIYESDYTLNNHLENNNIDTQQVSQASGQERAKENDPCG